jgi:protein-disulfide isomerase
MNIFGRILALCAIGAASLAPTAAESPAASPPAIDKPTVAKYLRYAEGFSPQVEISVADPKPSVFPGLYEVRVTLRANRNEVVRTYYLTPDGARLISGSVFDLHNSPFRANLALLKEGGAPVLGPAKAPVQIFVFSDFECPYCKQEAQVLRRDVEKDHANDVRIVFKDFPLESIHPWARRAALAGQCIAAQNPSVFWTFHDWIYEHQGEVNPANLNDKIAQFTKAQNLDQAKLSACEASPQTASRVDETVSEGRQLGITQTPTLFVNGRMIPGVLTPDQMDRLIDLELGHQKEAASGGTCCRVDIPSVAEKH